jgi:predicted alpha/beta hydrolase
MNETLNVLAWDGYPISCMHYIPENQTGKVLLLVNGTGQNQKKYSTFSQYFAEHGYDVYTFDFRGIGASRQGKLSDVKSDLKDWATLDLDAVISYIVDTHKNHKLVIAAHGMGGVLTGHSRLSKKADAFLFISCQSPYHKHLRGIFTNVKYSIFAHALLPALTRTFGYFPASKFGLCDDLPKNVAYQLVAWTRSLNGVVEEDSSAESGFQNLDQRSLSISFSDDPIATPEAVQGFISFFKKLRPEQWHFTPDQLVQKSVGHFGFFKKSMKSLVWSETLGWINATLATARKKAA